ncbi:hypothetical protein T12_5786 [Trichinella patagoniensis]|uniref:Uncharacterized protein n=1 Tax=Trichinella patagoniensis TaxID=990121 RepID=A0A0V1AE01_9BILA|nr:hypothetical protein T12_5786 [Trichinella patagoniensis]
MKTFNVFQERRTNNQLVRCKFCYWYLMGCSVYQLSIHEVNWQPYIKLKCWSKISKSVNTVKCLFLPFASQLLRISQTNCTTLAVFSGYIN